MTTISSFIKRLERIGISVELVGNYPWVYLDKVNGLKVMERYQANHGFTCFWRSVKIGEPENITDVTIVFNKIRQMLCNPKMDIELYKKQMEDYYS